MFLFQTHPTLTTTETFDWNLLDVSEETKSLQNSSSNLQQNDIFDPDFDFPNFFVTESTLQQSNIVFPNQPSPPLFQSNFRHHQYSIDPPQSRTISQSPVLTRSPLFQSQISMTEIPNKYSVFEDLDRQLRETKTNMSNANLAITEGIRTFCTTLNLIIKAGWSKVINFRSLLSSNLF